MSRYLPFAFLVVFFIVGFNAYINSKPSQKAPIYKKIKKYSPYYLEKRFGGLQIRKKGDLNFKEKPSNMEIFHRLEALEKEWGRKHLVLKGEKLFIITKDKNISINVKDKKDLQFLKKYYGLVR